MIITDHHKVLSDLPEALAVVNPQCSPDFDFKEICGAAVAFKLAMALADHYLKDKQTKKQVLDYFLPFVAIATVADCMPLVEENRLFVKK